MEHKCGNLGLIVECQALKAIEACLQEWQIVWQSHHIADFKDQAAGLFQDLKLYKSYRLVVLKYALIQGGGHLL